MPVDWRVGTGNSGLRRRPVRWSAQRVTGSGPCLWLCAGAGDSRPPPTVTPTATKLARATGRDAPGLRLGQLNRGSRRGAGDPGG